MIKFISLFSLIIVIAGCASSGTNFDSRRIGDIKKGETTEADLVKMFGQPNTRSVNSESGESLMWIYSEARTKGETFIPLAGAFVGGVKSKTKTLMVMLDQQGKVSSFNYSGGGFGTSGTTQADPEDNKPPQVAKSPRNQ